MAQVQDRKRLMPPPPAVQVFGNRTVSLLNFMGEGGYAVVWLADVRLAGKPGAAKAVIKRVDLTQRDQVDVAACIREAELLKGIKHAFILSCQDHWKDGGYLYMQMEHCANKDLRQYLTRAKRARKSKAGPFIPEAELRYMLAQALLALDFLHRHGVVHRDIKPENILLKHSGLIKVADFNLASTSREELMEQDEVGTPGFMSPEMLKGTGYDAKTDSWSLGLTFGELSTGTPMIWSDTYDEVYEETMCFKMPDLPGYSAEWKGILSRLVEQRPEKRASPADLLKLKALSSEVARARRQMLSQQPTFAYKPASPPRQPASAKPQVFAHGAPVTAMAQPIAAAPPCNTISASKPTILTTHRGAAGGVWRTRQLPVDLSAQLLVGFRSTASTGSSDPPSSCASTSSGSNCSGKSTVQPAPPAAPLAPPAAAPTGCRGGVWASKELPSAVGAQLFAGINTKAASGARASGAVQAKQEQPAPPAAPLAPPAAAPRGCRGGVWASKELPSAVGAQLFAGINTKAASGARASSAVQAKQEQPAPPAAPLAPPAAAPRGCRGGVWASKELPSAVGAQLFAGINTKAASGARASGAVQAKQEQPAPPAAPLAPPAAAPRGCRGGVWASKELPSAVGAQLFAGINTKAASGARASSAVQAKQEQPAPPAAPLAPPAAAPRGCRGGVWASKELPSAVGAQLFAGINTKAASGARASGAVQAKQEQPAPPAAPLAPPAAAPRGCRGGVWASKELPSAVGAQLFAGINTKAASGARASSAVQAKQEQPAPPAAPLAPPAAAPRGCRGGVWASKELPSAVGAQLFAGINTKTASGARASGAVQAKQEQPAPPAAPLAPPAAAPRGCRGGVWASKELPSAVGAQLFAGINTKAASGARASSAVQAKQEQPAPPAAPLALPATAPRGCRCGVWASKELPSAVGAQLFAGINTKAASGARASSAVQAKQEQPAPPAAPLALPATAPRGCRCGVWASKELPSAVGAQLFAGINTKAASGARASSAVQAKQEQPAPPAAPLAPPAAAPRGCRGGVWASKELPSAVGAQLFAGINTKAASGARASGAVQAKQEQPAPPAAPLAPPAAAPRGCRGGVWASKELPSAVGAQLFAGINTKTASGARASSAVQAKQEQPAPPAAPLAPPAAAPRGCRGGVWASKELPSAVGAQLFAGINTKAASGARASSAVQAKQEQPAPPAAPLAPPAAAPRGCRGGVWASKELPSAVGAQLFAGINTKTASGARASGAVQAKQEQPAPPAAPLAPPAAAPRGCRGGVWASKELPSAVGAQLFAGINTKAASGARASSAVQAKQEQPAPPAAPLAPPAAAPRGCRGGVWASKPLKVQHASPPKLEAAVRHALPARAHTVTVCKSADGKPGRVSPTLDTICLGISPAASRPAAVINLASKASVAKPLTETARKPTAGRSALQPIKYAQPASALRTAARQATAVAMSSLALHASTIRKPAPVKQVGATRPGANTVPSQGEHQKAVPRVGPRQQQVVCAQNNTAHKASQGVPGVVQQQAKAVKAPVAGTCAPHTVPGSLAEPRSHPLHAVRRTAAAAGLPCKPRPFPGRKCD